jgi:membrane-associated phospholipid phosphatase
MKLIAYFWLAFVLFAPRLCLADLAETAKNTFAFKTLGQDLVSPVTTPAKYALIAGTTITVATMIFKKDFEEPINDQMKEHRPLGRNGWGDKFGQLVPNAFYLGSMLGAYALAHDELYLRRADLMFRSTLHSGVITILMKNIFRAERPYDPNVKTSFPSGHAASTFAFASAIAMEHEWYWGLGAYTLATYVGASRINDHQHHLRDVLAGATIGISYGMGIYYRMLNERSSTGSAQTRREESFFALVPTNELDGAAFLLRRRF